MGRVVPDVGPVVLSSAAHLVVAGLIVVVVAGCGDDASGDGADDLGPAIDMSEVSPDGSAGDDGGAPGDLGTDAGPEPCDVEGETRAVECGNCGLGQERCEDGLWVLGECLNEKECAPGELEEEDLGMCAARARICDTACEWGEWDMVAEAGECEAGEMRMWAEGCEVDETKPQMCSDSCTWEDLGACTSGCTGTRRTSPAMAEEICVPAGPFVRGDSTFDDSPVSTVMLTYSYYIDRFPVSNGRYRECVDAGVCTELPSVTSNYNEPAYADYAAGGFSWEAAQEFCNWDGGRRLLTEAEWEKAARGPAPRDQPWTWNDASFRCDYLPATRDCPDPEPYPTAPPYLELSDRWPMARSYYGVDGMIGNIRQWTADWYSESYYESPDSLVDPQGPTSGTARARRGISRAALQENLRLGRREPGLAATQAIRCGRTAP